MSKFMNDLKNYFKGELREKYNFDTQDMIVFYEAINQNQDKEDIKNMINDCNNFNCIFTYEDSYEKTGGYIKGEIAINIEDKPYNYQITLNNYEEKVFIKKNGCISISDYFFEGQLEDVENEWKEELRIYKINKIQEKIRKKEQYILEIGKEISILQKELESLRMLV